MKNIENCKLVLDQIEKHPETWYQKKWHCGTTHCFAGWAQILSGKPEDVTTVRRDARIFLGLTKHEASYYFYGGRTMDELRDILVEGGYDGYDPDGYDMHGFDREGYDRMGRDVHGLNKSGYDRDGFNREGYDRYGYDVDGLDKNNQPRPN